MTPRQIGIVACSAEGAALCYRTICVEGAAILGSHAHPEVTVHTPSFADYMTCIYRGDWAGVGELMLASAQKLKAVGADFLICPDNTIHQAMPAQGLTYMRPTPEERDEINRIIMDELVCSVFKAEAVTYFQRVFARMKDAGCDAVVLGCTEIPLIMNDANSPLPTLDSTRLLARAALRRAVAT